jgi:DNA-directed RNA polymerase specialized sigma24 family protein
MKYEPKNNRPTTEAEAMLLPFFLFDEAVDNPAHDEMLDIVAECVASLSESDQECLTGVFYDRLTYEELSDRISVKAKSHAWKKTQAALERLKKALLKNERFLELAHGHYGDAL